MDEDKIKKLEEKLYSQTPFIGDRIKQQALKELIELRTVSAIESLSKALIFYQESDFGKKIFSALSQLKIQEDELINAVCRIWTQQRAPELSKMLKLKGWVASRPTELRLLTSLNLGWRGIIEEKGVSIVKPLLDCFDDQETWIANVAKQWANSFYTDKKLQEEVCRLATEENNQVALEVATKNGYIPSAPSQSALFYYLTQQWEEYQKIDPDFKILEQTYYNGSSELKQRIDKHGQALKREEWVWMRLGGKEGRRLTEIKNNEWNNILETLFQAQKWETAWSLIPYVPTIWTEKIVSKLMSKRLSISDPDIKLQVGKLNQLWKELSQKTPSQGKLVRLLYTLEGHPQTIEALAISPDNNTLISAGGEEIYVWNLNDGSLMQTLKGHLKPVTTLCFDSTGSMFASGSRDQTISLWRLPEGNLIANLSRNNSSVWSLATTDDLKIIASAGYQEVRLWKYPPGSLAKVLRGHKREVEKVIINREQDLLITAGGTRDNNMIVWSLPEGEKKFTLTGHLDGISDLVITPNNQTLVSAGKDAQIKLWSLVDGQEIATLTGHQGKIWCLAITPDGTTLVSGSEDKTVKVWSVTKGKIQYDLNHNEQAVVCLDISNDGKLLVTGSLDGTVKLWDLTTGKLMNNLKGHQSGVSVVKFSGNGETLITAGKDKTIKLWRWDLSRLANLPLMSITPKDRQWIKKTFKDDNILPEERQWLSLIQTTLSLKL